MPARAIQIGINIGMLVVCTLVSVVLLELAIRIFLPVYTPSDQLGFVRLGDVTVGRPGGVFRLSKNAGDFDVEIRFNALGFRDDKSLTTSTDRDFFVVGDSIALGWGVAVRDRFSDQLESLLKCPVFNIAMPAYDLDGYDRLMYYAEANGASIKNLIISVSMEHNLRIYDTSHRASSPLYLMQPPQGKLKELKEYLVRHSALYIALTYNVHQTPWLRRIAVRLGLLIPEHDVMPDLVGSTEAALTTSALRIVQLARGRNAIVLIIPSRRLWVDKTADRAEAARIHEAFIKKIKESGMIVIDLRDGFEQSGNPLSYHFANDAHWNKEGHRLAAEALAEVLQPFMR
jgi:SGNH hydrolase-like domain, acetyltransferase AlgX